MHPADPRCTLEHRSDIVAVVERLRSERALMAIEFGDGHAIVSSVLEVRGDIDALIFDVARDPEQNRHLFMARSLSFVSELEGIEISFQTKAATLVTLADGPAALVELPRALVRLQRREWFRAALPIKPPVRCALLDEEGNVVPGQAIDLSEGGAAVVIDDPAGGQAKPGSDHELILSLPEIGRLELGATLRTVIPITGKSKVRLGLRFESLSAQTANRIQRYVQHIEVTQLRMLKGRD